MKLFDCTLRDGANVVGNGFSPELTESMVKNLLRCGIQDIELGNAKCMNVVLFGAMCDALGCPEIDWEEVVAETVPAKVKELNLKAFRAGREAARKAL